MIAVEDQIRAYAQAITAEPSTDGGMPTYGSPREPLASSGRGRYLVAAAVVVALLVSGVLIARGEESERPTLSSTTTTEPDDGVEVATTKPSTIEPAGLDETTASSTLSPWSPPSEDFREPLASFGNDVIFPPADPNLDPVPTRGPPPGPLADPSTTSYWITNQLPLVVRAGDPILITVHATNTSGASAYVPSQLGSAGCLPFLVQVALHAYGKGCDGWSEIPAGESEWTISIETREVTCHPDASVVGGEICLPDPTAPAFPPGEIGVYVWVGDLLLPPAWVLMTLT